MKRRVVCKCNDYLIPRATEANEWNIYFRVLYIREGGPRVWTSEQAKAEADNLLETQFATF
jgi:hypothetical protein